MKSCIETIGWQKAQIKIQKIRLKKKILFRENYYKNPKRCKFCVSILSFEKRRGEFCTHSCSAKFNNKGIKRHGDTPSSCLQCKKKNQRSISKYCSIDCQHKYEFHNIIFPNFERGLVRTRAAKRCIVFLYGNKCQNKKCL